MRINAIKIIKIYKVRLKIQSFDIHRQRYIQYANTTQYYDVYFILKIQIVFVAVY